jgi:hypothetical protein
LRIEAKCFELPAPFGRSIAESLDADAARQATFDRRFDEVRREECERNRHVDLTQTAFLTCCDLLNVSNVAMRLGLVA